MDQCSGEHGQDTDAECNENQDLKLHREIRAGESDDSQNQSGSQRDHQIIGCRRGKVAAYGFGKTENVERDGDPLRKEQRHSDGAPEPGAESAGDQEVDTAAFDRRIG